MTHDAGGARARKRPSVGGLHIRIPTTMFGDYTQGPAHLRARALECAMSRRQRQLVLGHAPWSGGDKPNWNQHHYKRGAWNLIGRIRAAGVECHLVREHVPRLDSTGATHRLVLILGPKDNSFPCECRTHDETPETTEIM